MTFILVPSEVEDIQVNAWNWRPTVEFLRSENLISDDHAERLGIHGRENLVDGALAGKIAVVLEKKLLAMKPGEYIRADLTVTAKPKVLQVFSPGTNPAEIDNIELYSASYEWLITFMDFCRRCGGFSVY